MLRGGRDIRVGDKSAEGEEEDIRVGDKSTEGEEIAPGPWSLLVRVPHFSIHWVLIVEVNLALLLVHKGGGVPDGIRGILHQDENLRTNPLDILLQ